MVYIIWAYTGDFYEPEILYAIAETLEMAKKLKRQCVDEVAFVYRGKDIKVYEGARIKKVNLNEEL